MADRPETTPPSMTALRLWTELAAMAARARQQESWHLMPGGHAQDLDAAEAVLRETKVEACKLQSESGTAQQIIAEVVAGHMSGADCAYKEHERAARDIEIALGIAGFRIVRSEA